MRLIMTLLLLVASASSAAADDLCGQAASSSVIAVKSWTIKPIDKTTNHMTETIAYLGDRPVRMIDGSIIFEDALGQSIGSMSIDRDAHLQPGVDYVQTGDWGQFTFERLLVVEPADIHAYSCVRGVVYADGSKEAF